MDKVAVIGQGYVGLPLALEISQAEMTAFGVDTNSEIVSLISQGESPIEGIDKNLILSQLTSGAYQATTDFSIVESCQIIVICVPTPLNSAFEPDVTYI